MAVPEVTAGSGSRIAALSSLLLVAGAADVAFDEEGGALWTVLGVVVAGIVFQCGRTYVRLGSAPVYPRANYYGEADIAPERPGAETAVRRATLIAGLAASAAAVVTGAALWITDLAVPWRTLALAAAIAAATGPAVGIDASRREESLRGRYVLYLRSFSSARSWIVLAVTLAAAPARVVAVLSPRRAEVRSVPWYLFAAVFPVQFRRMEFWTTSSDQWNRVVASCMNSARGMVVDYTALPREMVEDAPASGVELEVGLSHSFAGTRPTAYLLERDRPLPLRAPTPSLLQISGTPIWVVRRFPALVRRLRAVLTRRLSPAELAYLDQFYATFEEDWRAAMISDRNLAAREGGRDPREVILARDPLAELQAEGTIRKPIADDP